MKLRIFDSFSDALYAEERCDSVYPMKEGQTAEQLLLEAREECRALGLKEELSDEQIGGLLLLGVWLNVGTTVLSSSKAA